ncbi:DNA-directed DNA polymerase [Methanospirillum stamsii]|uniref:DNA polymerase n=1 Tax=Methanospirillum stamsii TaxID=1277351 RepID=A0A2V2MZQ6_9EURY|nr:DNA-directed DNA polymerase [Methanospirillum stamsii]PWR73372.1 DNA polymerase [Methanospirillum stamsii]
MEQFQKTDSQKSDQERIQISINQVEYSTAADGPIIHIFGRNGKGDFQEIQVTGFYPYFYIPVSQVTRNHPDQVLKVDNKPYQSIHGEELRRLYTKRPSDVRDVRSEYKHFEADIPFATRYLIDAGITGGIEVPAGRTVVPHNEVVPAEVHAPSRYCLLDIECEDDKGGLPTPDRDRIICITTWDSFDDYYTTFLLQNDGKSIQKEEICHKSLVNGCFNQETHTVRIFENETTLLRDFSHYIKEKNPDILSGWNFTDFDLPFIFGRIRALGLPPDSLARLPGMSERSGVRGRVDFDLLSAYKKMQSSKLDSYRLDAVGEREVGDVKAFHYQPGMTTRMWNESPEELVEYNFKDVELCVKINQKNNIIEFYQEIAKYVGCPLDRTLNSSNVIDIYILRKAHGKFILPSKGYSPGDEFEGATVFEPSSGIRENVVVLDLKSLYPMAMMTINASPETKNPEGDLIAPNGIRFYSKPDGLTRSIISELLLERDFKKNKRNEYPFGSAEYHLFDMQQNVIKVIMNTYYGVSGYSRFRLYDREIGSAVTSVGRAIIEHTRNIIENMGYTVIYGDTDSCMIQIPSDSLDETITKAREIEAILNESYNTFAKDKLHAEKHYFSIKFEKVYRRFFQGGKKKRYAGNLIWKEGKSVDEIDMVGFEAKRSDSPLLTRTVMKEVMNRILQGAELPEIKKYLGDIIKKYRTGGYSLDEIGIPGGIGKELKDYETDDAHVRGATYANKNFGTNFGKGSKPKRIYIKAVNGGYPKTDVICFEYGDQVPKEFTVDLELMLEKTLKSPISRILEPIGWTWSDVDPSRTTLSDFF